MFCISSYLLLADKIFTNNGTAVRGSYIASETHVKQTLTALCFCIYNGQTLAIML